MNPDSQPGKKKGIFETLLDDADTEEALMNLIESAKDANRDYIVKGADQKLQDLRRAGSQAPETPPKQE